MRFLARLVLNGVAIVFAAWVVPGLQVDGTATAFVAGALLGMVMKQIGGIAAVAIVIGVAVALGVGRLAESLLFGVSGYNVVAFGLAIAVISAVALAAGFLPARRASRVAPMEALREQ